MKIKCSSTVKLSYKTSFCKQRPNVYLISSKLSSKFYPLIVIFPPFFSIKPVNKEMVVVFPAPI